jgi:hypothetical protein
MPIWNSQTKGAAMNERLDRLKRTVDFHLDCILREFKGDAKITVGVTNDQYGDAGVVMGNDNLDRVVEEIRRRQTENLAASRPPDSDPTEVIP